MNIKHRLATLLLPVLSVAMVAPAMAQMAAGQRLNALRQEAGAASLIVQRADSSTILQAVSTASCAKGVL